MKFTESYRSLTRIPMPVLKKIDAKDFVDVLYKFFEPVLLEKGIQWQVNFLFHQIKFDADPILLEQVFINIIKNSIEALENCASPEINIIVEKTNVGKVSFQLIDNGKGISREELDKIFVPFYTTKANGSGIGLSLSQQIIRLHGGNIYLESRPDKGTKATIVI